MKLEISKTQGFKLETDKIASDKSISHRCAIFALLSNQPSFVRKTT